MRIQTFKLFQDLAETSSFTKTAQINNLTQASVSQRIGNLERSFGVPLVVRSRKHFRLTREGEMIYSNSREMLDAYREMLGKLQEIKGTVSGQVQIATQPHLGMCELKELLTGFSKVYPDVRIELNYGSPAQIIALVRKGRAHLGLLPFAESADDLEVVPLQKDKIDLVFPEGHPMAGETPLEMAQLKGVRRVAHMARTYWRRVEDQILSDAGVEMPVALESDLPQTRFQAISLNAGVGLIRQGLFQLLSADFPTLQSRPLAGVEGVGSLVAVVSKAKALPESTEKLIQFLAQA